LLRLYEDGDLDKFPERHAELFLPPQLKQFTLDNSDSFTWLADGKPVAVFGFLDIGMGVANCWATISDNVRGHGFAFTRACQRALNNWTEVNNIYLIQCLVEADNKEYQRWIELSGFYPVHTLLIHEQLMLVYEKRWHYLQS